MFACKLRQRKGSGADVVFLERKYWYDFFYRLWMAGNKRQMRVNTKMPHHPRYPWRETTGERYSISIIITLRVFSQLFLIPVVLSFIVRYQRNQTATKKWDLRQRKTKNTWLSLFLHTKFKETLQTYSLKVKIRQNHCLNLNNVY